MITLYQFEISPYCDKVRRALTYKGLEFRTQEMLFSRREENLEVSPTHKFPVLEHAGERIVDSTDIAYYLEEHFPEPRLIPAEPEQRARMHIVEDWADESLFTYDLAMRGLWSHNLPSLIEDVFRYESPELKKAFAESVPEQIQAQLVAQGIGRKSREAILRDVRRHFEAVDALLQAGPFLIGDALCYADIAVRAMTYVIARAREGEEMLREYPAILAWEGRVDRATLPRD